ncbi:hypothetical protein [Nafulsella turpanensis]|uniref:hypothetical protein n=1 Tax=Nafulsella turpanensis TaxID=1265690 RepID=UPI0003455DB9|nr:hypothetical protein [Nafulsella turpanensis]
MRNLSRTGLSLLCWLGLSFLQPLQAQFVVYDPAQFGNMIKSLANEIQLIAKATETLKETRHILETAERTKEEIENIYSLQWEVEAALERAGSIRELRWAGLEGFAVRISGLSTDPQVFLPELTGLGPLRNGLGSAAGVENARRLYRLLSGLHAASPPLASYAEWEALTEHTLLYRFSLEEMSKQKKVQAALSYNELAEEMIAQAGELIRVLKSDQWLKMNEAERLSLLKECQEVLDRSLQMKLESDELLRSVAEENSASKEALLQAYRNRLVRKALAETPQQKVGNSTGF